MNEILIKRLANGRISVKHSKETTVMALNEVLKAAFKSDFHALGKKRYYLSSGNEGYWKTADKAVLPSVNVDEFFNKPKRIAVLCYRKATFEKLKHDYTIGDELFRVSEVENTRGVEFDGWIKGRDFTDFPIRQYEELMRAISSRIR